MSNLVGFSGTNGKGFPEHLSIEQLSQLDHHSGTQNDPLVENPDSLLDIITQSLPDFSSHELDQLNMALGDSDISCCLQSQSDLVNALQMSPQKYPKHQEPSEYLKLSKLLPDHLNLLSGPLLEDDEDWQTLLSPHYHDLPTTSNSKLLKKQDTRATPFDETKESIANLFQHYKFTDYSQKKPPDPGPAISSLRTCSDLSNTGFEGSESDEEIDVVTVDEDDKDSCRAKLLNDDCSAARCNPVTKVWFSKHVIQLNALKNLSTHLEQNTLENCQSTEFLNLPKPALEATDMNSLLEQFEASADINSSLQHAQIVPIADVEAYSDTASPSSRKIMSRDSSPSSIIDRIKSSTLNKKGIVLIKPEDAVQSKKSNKGPNSQSKHQQPAVTEVRGPSSDSQNPVSFYNALDHDYCGVSKIPDYLIQLSPPKNSFGSTVKGSTEPSVQVVRPFQKTSEIENESLIPNQPDTTKMCEKLPVCLKDVSHDSVCKKTGEESLSELPGDNSVQIEKEADGTSVYTKKDSSCQKRTSVGKPVRSRSRSRSRRKSNNRSSSSSTSPVNRRHQKNRPQSSRSPSHSSVNSRCSRSWSHSRSRSSSYSSRNRSRSPSPVKYRRRCSRSRNSRYHKSRSHFQSQHWGYRRFYRRSRSRSPRKCYVRSSSEKISTQERRKKKFLEVEERRVIYVGNIPEGTTRTDLRNRFCKFGPIEEVSVHLRDHGDNYGFVTFHNRSDAFEALEHGNDDASYPKVDLCFGGRRQFCKNSYADLDSQAQHSAQKPFRNRNLDFDSLLQAAKANVGYK
ncbi:peroxisome proliferator-activated receptor gamma coactivator-related protein 1-like isoform X2 [Limulus polyphemus]|uniref:Peroxisome proliferator-activated receptor gamma coactivator-related protein 1-like isoform X2 n=1 Tax=Limulus polyphemus TaxID=6850 RepID=A0ABM1SY85_LIMPO|nr:peroxisome proliferator-activated receptor gamma coactivator-related protein 1-like isoform X2 [Limulus polyphemus]